MASSLALDPTAPPPDTGVVRAACPHDCPDTCAMLVTVEDGPRGDASRATPTIRSPRGFLCAKVNRYLERTYHRDRLTHAAARASAQRARASSSASRGTRRSTTIAARLDAIAARATARRRSCRTRTPARWASCRAASMDRRFFHLLGASQARPHDLLDGRHGGHADDRRRRTSAPTPRGFRESDLVLLWGTNTLTSNPHLWPFVLEAREQGARVIAIDPLRTRTADAVRRVDRASARHRRGARARHDARDVRARGSQDDDYLAQHTLGASELRARARGVPAGARRRRSPGFAAETIVSLGRRVRAREGGVHPRELRPAAPRRRRHGGAHHRVPARGHRPLAARGRRRAARLERELPVRQGGARAAGPLAAGAHDQHDPAGRGAHAARRRRRRPAGEGARRLQLESRPRSRRTATRCCAAWRARTCSPSCSSISRPTPRTTPTSCCRRRRSSSTGTCTSSYGHHYVTLNRPAIAPLGEASRTARSSACSPRAWASTHAALQDDDVTLIRQALDSGEREDARA